MIRQDTANQINQMRAPLHWRRLLWPLLIMAVTSAIGLLSLKTIPVAAMVDGPGAVPAVHKARAFTHTTSAETPAGPTITPPHAPPAAAAAVQTNTAPLLWPLPPKTVSAGERLRFAARVTDADLPGQPLSFTLDAGSVGSIDLHTGFFTWTPGVTAWPETYTGTVRVNDGEFEDSTPFTITVYPDVPGRGYWVAVNDNVLSNFSIIDARDDTVHGPFLADQLGTNDGGRFDVAVTPDGRTALISNFGDGVVYPVDLANPLQPTLITSVTIPFFAEDIAISPEGRYALVADGGFSSVLATIDIPAASLVYTTELDTAMAQGVAIAPDGTVVVPDYSTGAIHAFRLVENGVVITPGITYSYTYPGLPLTDTMPIPEPVNIGIAPDGRTVVVCTSSTSTVGIYKIIAPGVLTFTGVVTGLHGMFPDDGDFTPGVQSIAFNDAGTQGYALINDMVFTSTNFGDRLGVLDITAPGEVSLAAGGVATLPHQTASQFFGVDVIAAAGRKAYAGYPTVASEDLERPVAIVDLTGYRVTKTMVLTEGVSIPTSIATVPRRLDLHLDVSDRAPKPEDIVTFTLVLVNGGPQLTGITLRQPLSPGLAFVGPILLTPPEAGSVGSAPPELVTNLVISAGQQVTVSFSVRIGTLLGNTNVPNTATAASLELGNPASSTRVLAVAPVPTSIVPGDEPTQAAAQLYLPAIAQEESAAIERAVNATGLYLPALRR